MLQCVIIIIIYQSDKLPFLQRLGPSSARGTTCAAPRPGLSRAPVGNTPRRPATADRPSLMSNRELDCLPFFHRRRSPIFVAISTPSSSSSSSSPYSSTTRRRVWSLLGTPTFHGELLSVASEAFTRFRGSSSCSNPARAPRIVLPFLVLAHQTCRASFS